MSNKRFSLKRAIVYIFVIGWAIPVTAIIFFISYLTNVKAIDSLNTSVLENVQSAVEVTKSGVLVGIDSMNNSAFDTALYEAHVLSLTNEQKSILHDSVTSILSFHFKSNNLFVTSMVYFINDEDTIYSIGNSQNENTLAHVDTYKNTVHTTTKKIDTNLGRNIKFLSYDNTLYMIRAVPPNEDNEIYAVMVMEIDEKQLFRGLNSILWLKDATVTINNTEITTSGIGVPLFRNRDEDSVYTMIEEGGLLRIRINQTIDHYELVYLVLLDRSPIFDIFTSLSRIIYPIVLIIILLFVALIGIFMKHFNKPVDTMVDAAKKIQEGHLGYQIEDLPSSYEFNYLTDNFNKMSMKTKLHFERSNKEQIALHNEKIKALQSQINPPHFLNNTLEIIGWEARAAKNDQITMMIDALGTMMSAAIHRNGETCGPLNEELELVDAFLLITHVRIGGDRFIIEKDIDTSLLEVSTPKMILQPIVENAVEKGMQLDGSFKIILRVYKKDAMMFIEIENEGDFDEKDQKSIASLLKSDNYDSEGIQVGIRNVNYRLKLIYGEIAELKIFRSKNATTISQIILPIIDEFGQYD